MTPAQLLLCTDLDRTLIPNGPQVESPGALSRFRQLAARPEIILTYVSGRHLDLVLEGISEHQLPMPDFIVADVGTTILFASGNDWLPLPGWASAIGRDWGLHEHQDLVDIFRHETGLRLQEPDKQNRYKLSYYVSPSADYENTGIGMQQRLAAAGIRARLVFSSDVSAGQGLLDVLPARASKYHALEALLGHLGFGHDNTMFSGDSGNDLEVLISPIPSVLVANATQEIKEQAHQRALSAGNADRLYIAGGGFLGMNGNYSAGILEGIAHYHPQAVAWMQ